jgi:hypothetical protein
MVRNHCAHTLWIFLPAHLRQHGLAVTKDSCAETYGQGKDDEPAEPPMKPYKADTPNDEATKVFDDERFFQGRFLLRNLTPHVGMRPNCYFLQISFSQMTSL